MGKLKNLTVLITGGTGILGNRMAYALGKEGATVIISGLNAKKIATSVSYLREHAIDARGVEMNVLDESSIENALNIIKEFSIRSIDIYPNIFTNSYSHWNGSITFWYHDDYESMYWIMHTTSWVCFICRV